VIFDANAVINPRTMMIKSLNTLVANGTMTRSGSSDDFTFWTEINWIYVVEKLQKGVIIKWLKISWIFAGSSKE